ncbi:MAG: glutamate synthase subunit beta [Bacteroidota bacterium]|nr:glutamate synthase subunit beta [Candidatus Kapabacteria bacterium]MDW8221006.1 glutamate synthase subunit beta [Bacteroidota bacterium]
MGKPTGFLEFQRTTAPKQSVEERKKHFGEFEYILPVAQAQEQGARCMDCGTPFCMSGCPLGNLIPSWNDLVYQNDWRTALDQLHATNNFPEFTGRTCPAPCESSCVLAINSPAVAIKSIENAIIERAFAEGWIIPEPPAFRTGKRVAIIGSGPAGLAAAQQLNRVGHSVTVFEKSDRIGGLLTYGIPNFKLSKSVVERRIEQLRAEGIKFCLNTEVGVKFPAWRLRREFDAVILAIGSSVERDLPLEGRELSGIYLAMEYLTQQNRIDCGDTIPHEGRIDAEGKHVVVIGSGDTAADCIGTAHRQGAASVTQFDIHTCPPEAQIYNVDWPYVPAVLIQSTSHEEGCQRMFTVLTQRFVGNAMQQVVAIEAVRLHRNPRPEERTMPHLTKGEKVLVGADLVLIAVGFSYPEYQLLRQLDVETTKTGKVAVRNGGHTSQPGIFAAGDCTRGASLVVWAIAEGRSIAHSVDVYLMGESTLPNPLQDTIVIDHHTILTL